MIRQVPSNPFVNYTRKPFFYSIIFTSLEILGAVEYVVILRRAETIMSHDCILYAYHIILIFL